MPVWGQGLVHDMLRTLMNTEDAAEAFDLPFRGGDSGVPPFRFTRAQHQLDSDGRRRSVNGATAFLDLSNIYGTSQAQADSIREFSGGRLRLVGWEDDPRAAMPPEQEGLPAGVLKWTLLDARDMVSAGTGALVVLLMREHNRRADWMAARAAGYPNEGWPTDDDGLFDAARAWVIGMWQKISVEEYLPTLVARRLPMYYSFDSDVHPMIDTVFAAAAFRYGHSALPSAVIPLDKSWAPATSPPFVLLRDSFGNAYQWASSRVVPEGADALAPIFRGLIGSRDNEVDLSVVSDMRGGYFEPSFDLAAINIMRGRELGLPRYNEAREAYGLLRAESFFDITGEDPAAPEGSVAADLSAAYDGDVDALDVWVGMLAEPPAAGAQVGPLAAASILDQFTRLRDGDPFWWEGDRLLSSRARQAMRDRSFADLVADNTDFGDFVPRSVFASVVLDADGIDAVQPPAGNCGMGGNMDEVELEFPFGVGFSSFYSLRWRVDLDDEEQAEEDLQAGVTPAGTLHLAVMLTGNFVWGGFGIGSDMVEADLTTVWVDAAQPSGASSADKWSTFFDPESDVELGGTESTVEGATSLEVRDVEGVEVKILRVARPLRAQDADRDLDVPVGSSPFIYAYGTSTMPSYHGPENRGSLRLNLFTGDIECGSGVQVLAVKELHAVTMAVAWGVLAPAGFVVARYYKHKDWWLTAHENLQKAAVSGAVPLAAVAFAGRGEGGHFSRPHATIGIIAMLCVLVQVALGLLTEKGLHWFAADRWHWIVRHGHRYTGRALILTGIVNIFYGLDWLFDEPFVWQLGVGVWIGVVGLVVAWHEFANQTPAAAAAVGHLVLSVVTCGGALIAPLPCCRRLTRRLRRHGRTKVASGGDGGGGGRSSDSDSSDGARELPILTWKAINERVAHGAEWVVVSGMVINLSNWTRSHPGGILVLQEAFGTDVTGEFLGEAVDATIDDETVLRATRRSILGVAAVPAKQDSSATEGDDAAETDLRSPSRIGLRRRVTSRRGVGPFSKSKRLRKRRRRTHKHSSAAWAKLSELVVGILSEAEPTASGTRPAKGSDAAEEAASRATSIQQLLLSDGDGTALVQGRDRGRRSALADAAAAASAARTKWKRSLKRQETLRPSVLSSTRLHRVVLASCEPLNDEGVRDAMWRFEFVLPPGLRAPPVSPRQHYWLVVSDPISHELIERQYSPMISSAAALRLRERLCAERGAPPPSAVVDDVSEVMDLSGSNAVVGHDLGDSSDGGAAKGDGAVSVSMPRPSASEATAEDALDSDGGSGSVVFCIKLYHDGLASQILAKLRIGDSVRLRGPCGPPLLCEESHDGRWTHLGMVAAGSGITPALQLIRFHLAGVRADADAPRMRLSLLFVNRSEENIILRRELLAAAAASRGVLRVHLALTRPKRPDEWAGYVGRPTAEMLRETMPPAPTGDDHRGRNGHGAGGAGGPARAARPGSPPPVPPPTVRNTRIAVIGPKAMAKATRAQLLALGFPPDTVVDMF